MATANSSKMEMMTLGRPFQLGMLYDSRNDQLIPGITLWDRKMLKVNNDDSPPKPASNYEILKQDTLHNKTHTLGIGGSLKISVLAGMIEVSGSAKYVHDCKTTEHQERLVLKYSTETRFEQLTMDHLGKGNAKYPEVFDQQTATHVVTGIMYGAEAFFIFDRTFSSDENSTEIHGHLEAMLKKIPKFDVSGKCQLDLNDNEKRTSEKLMCQFYGDFHLETNPSTFEDAAKLYQQLPSLLGKNHEKAVPKKVWLYPLHLLDNSAMRITRDISNNLVTMSVTLLDDLHGLEIKANDLMSNAAHGATVRRNIEQLSTFRARIAEFRTDVKKQIIELMPKIRGGTTEEIELANLFKRINLSPFNKQKLADWLDLKTKELERVNGFVRILSKEANIGTSSSSLDEALSDLNCEFTFCLAIHVVEKDDLFLREMYQYLNDNTWTQVNQPASIIHWLDQPSVLESVRTSMRSFLEFAKANNHKENIKFVVDEQYSDKHKVGKGASAILYQNGTVVSFQIPSKPGKPQATDITYEKIMLTWPKPNYGSEYVQQYKIYAQKNSDHQWTQLSITDNPTESQLISNLMPETIYKFKIQASTVAGDTAESELSDPIQTKAIPLASAATRMLTVSDLIRPASDGFPNIYKIRYEEQIINKTMHLRKCSIGERVPMNGTYPIEKIILLIGVSGGGKTTLVNALVNHYYGTAWKDSFRLRLITEEDESHSGVAVSQSQSQTKWISAYTLHCQQRGSVPYTLTIIDTPGFGDVGGIKRDAEIIDQIREFFTVTGPNGIDHIDGVGFVTPNSVTRLSPTQMYIFDSVLSIFGKDIKSNIFFLITFADGKEPPVLQAIKDAEIPYCATFKFNNSALFAKNCLTDEELETNFDEMFWKMGVMSLAKFLNNIQNVNAVSLSLTKEVLKERHHLETVLQGIYPQIRVGLHILDELQQEEQILKNHSNEVERNKDFEYTVTISKQRKIDLDPGIYVTNCLRCNMTCHFPCHISADGKKHDCAAMEQYSDEIQKEMNNLEQKISAGVSEAKFVDTVAAMERLYQLNIDTICCTVCVGKCSWKEHVNNSYRFEIYIEHETRTFEDLKNRYHVAKDELTKTQAICAHVQENFRQVERNVYGLISRAREALERLHEIALKPNPLSVVQYIELLIESEKQEAKLGWQQRIEHLRNAKQKAELLERVQDPSYSPFHSCESFPAESTSYTQSSANVEQTDSLENDSQSVASSYSS